MCQVEY